MIRVGLVLGAGGMTGQAFHGGVLAALHETHGFDATSASVIVGTSAGSLVGAVVRAGVNGPDMAARARDRRPSERAVAVFAQLGTPGGMEWRAPSPLAGPASAAAVMKAALRPWRSRPGSVAAAMLPAGKASTEPIIETFRRLFGSDWPTEKLLIPTVRLRDGRRIVHDGTGDGPDVATAIAASCAVPGVFKPVEIGDEAHVDGGAWSPTNADAIETPEVDAVVVSAPLSSSTGGGLTVAGRSMRLLHHRYLQRELADLRRVGVPVLRIEPSRSDLVAMGPNPMDWSRRQRVILAVREQTIRRLTRGDLTEHTRPLGLG